LITGGSRGIGRAIAVKFAQQGADIAIVYTNSHTEAQSVRAEIIETGARCEIYSCDVSDYEKTKTLVNQVLADFSGIDILVNNAGITKDGLILSMKEEDFNRVIDINLTGAFNMIRHTCLQFIKRRSGRIINVTSVVGLSGNAGQANYSSAKAGLIGLTKSVAKELAGRNILCNAIAPGFIKTDMTAEISDKARDSFLAMIPLKKPGTSEDVANAALFLASGLSGYVTGEVIRVDGGLAM